jgi:hypothetical protein
VGGFWEDERNLLKSGFCCEGVLLCEGSGRGQRKWVVGASVVAMIY